MTQNPDDWKAFKRKRNSTNKLKNSLKQTFYHDSFQESKDNPKELWKKVKQLIPDPSTSNISEIYDETNSVISNKKGIANRINKFFVNIGSKLASKFPASDTSKIYVKSANKTFLLQTVHCYPSQKGA